MSLDPFSVILAVSTASFFLAVYFLFLLYWDRNRRTQVLRRVNLDQLDGAAFETFVADLLTQRGYRVQQIGKPGDLGVDLIAEKRPYRFAVQAKRQSQPVSRRAVSDAVAGKAHYNCNAAMVITNNFFSVGAHELAHSNGCKLVDRNTLADWMLESSR
ncbi:MAG TPA: restriction endonuclease [Anaerolineae bacterium]|nr:restriction endonuclease [Anaerolineae bacterium]